MMSTGWRARHDAQGRILLQSRRPASSPVAPHHTRGGESGCPSAPPPASRAPMGARGASIDARVAGQRACFNRPCTALTLLPYHCLLGLTIMAWAGVGVGMSLEPSSDPGSDYCHVSSMKDGGALANDGRVKPGDKLVRVDGFDCMGVPRAVIKSRVLGPPNSEVVLEFQRDRRVFKVTLLRTSGFAATHSALAAIDQSGVVEHRKDRGKDPALGDGKTAAQAQLLSSNVRNSVSGSATSQAENGDREQGLERSARSQAAERFRGSMSSDKERGNGRDRNRDTDRTGDAEGRDRDRQ